MLVCHQVSVCPIKMEHSLSMEGMYMYAAVCKPYSQPFFHLRVKDKHTSTKDGGDGKSLVSHAELTEFDPAT